MEVADGDVSGRRPVRLSGSVPGSARRSPELSVWSAAREAPERIALVRANQAPANHAGGNQAQGERTMTWAELAERVNRLRAAVNERLEERHKRSEEHPEARARPVVAVVGGVGFETVRTVLALLEDRVSFVLLHPRWRRAERERALAMSGASLVIEEDGKPRMLPPAGTAAAAGAARAACVMGAAVSPGSSGGPAAAGSACSKNENPLGGGAVVVFTSGSTGRPRGAVLGHAALRASAAAHIAVFGEQPDDRWLLSLPVAHVGGLMIVVRSLLARRTIVLSGRQPNGSFDAEAALRTIDRHRVTLLSVVPTMLGRLLDGGVDAGVGGHGRTKGPPASLRAVLVGGAAAPPALMARARRLGWPVLATYGLTEACSQVATEIATGAAAEAARVDREAGTAGTKRPGETFGGAGKPLPGVEVRIASPDGPDGSAGSIRIRGPMLFDGYLGDEPREPLHRPFDEDGWFDTGDVGALDDSGRLGIVGRRSDRIVTGGENVDPTEVEAAVVEWPGAAAACVVGVDDDVWGERVGAVVVGSDGFENAGGLPALQEHLRVRLAAFKRPRRWKVVDCLPAAASDKVDREACRALLVGSGGADPGDTGSAGVDSAGVSAARCRSKGALPTSALRSGMEVGNAAGKGPSCGW